MKHLRVPYWPLLVVPSLSFGLGVLLNAIVIAANAGRMPVLLPDNCADSIPPEDTIHGCMSATSHLKWLADWFTLGGIGIASPGDFLIWAGYYIAVPALFAWFVLILKDYNSKGLYNLYVPPQPVKQNSSFPTGITGTFGATGAGIRPQC